MRFEVTILGNSSASPAPFRHQSAHVLNVREQFFLIDCGEGTRAQMLKAGISPLKIKAVFITHIHGDHHYGLAPLISSLGLAGKQTPLKIFGPPALGRLLDFFQYEFGQPVSFELDFTPVDTTAHQKIYENASMEVFTVPLRHRTPTAGYMFIEKADGQGHEPRSYAYLSDTMPSPKAAEIVREFAPKGVDILYHEATFADADRRLARETGHSTAVQAAKIASKAGAKRLILGHFSSRYKDLTPLQDEARLIFPATDLAEEGRSYSIPLKKQNAD
jgi:ribonuclease Z